MISYNQSEISLKSLNIIIEEIEEDEGKSNKQFGFDEFKYELDKIEFKNKTKYESVMRINEWVESDPMHTFPKTKQKWINTIVSQADLRNVFVNYKLKDIVSNIYLMEHIPLYIFDYYKKVFNNPKTSPSIIMENRAILCRLTPLEVFDNLVEYKLISIIGKRVYINRYIFENKNHPIYNTRKRIMEEEKASEPNKRMKM